MLIAPHQLRWIEDNLVANDIQFVVIGGVAVKYYQATRQTQDLDLFVGANPAKLGRLVEEIPQLRRDPNALAKLLDERVGHFKVEAPYLIDVLTFAPGLSMPEAYQTAEAHRQDETHIPILALSLLVAHKKAVGDQKDLEDVQLLAALERTNSEGPNDDR